MIYETRRLILRELGEDDLPALRAILQDAETMYAYEHAFSEEEVRAWLANQQRRYREDGFGLWAAVRRADGAVIGQCGLTWQDWEGRSVREIGYLFRRDCWKQGYAIEAARGCKRWAFSLPGVDEVFSIIRDTNLASRRVAERNGMTPRGAFVKRYYGIDMPHIVYGVHK